MKNVKEKLDSKRDRIPNHIRTLLVVVIFFGFPFIIPKIQPSLMDNLHTKGYWIELLKHTKVILIILITPFIAGWMAPSGKFLIVVLYSSITLFVGISVFFRDKEFTADNLTMIVLSVLTIVLGKMFYHKKATK